MGGRAEARGLRHARRTRLALVCRPEQKRNNSQSNAGRTDILRLHHGQCVTRHLYRCTNDIERRVWEHKTKRVKGFTKKHNCTRLVFFKEFERVDDAIAREKEIKGWLRKKKIALVEGRNGSWEDLSWGWFSAEVVRCAQDDIMKR